MGLPEAIWVTLVIFASYTAISVLICFCCLCIMIRKERMVLPFTPPAQLQQLHAQVRQVGEQLRQNQGQQQQQQQQARAPRPPDVVIIDIIESEHEEEGKSSRVGEEESNPEPPQVQVEEGGPTVSSQEDPSIQSGPAPAPL